VTSRKIAPPEITGFSAALCADLGQIIAAMFGPSSATLTPPFIAPVLVFSIANSQKLLDFPAPDTDRITVHEYQSITRNRPLPTDTNLALTLTIDPEKTANAPFGFQAEIASPDGNICATLNTRLRNLTVENFRRMRGTGLPRNIAPKALKHHKSAPISAALVARYVALSGDNNPLHVNDTYAQSFGLDRAIIPGMLLIGGVENALAALLPHTLLTETRVRFLAPVLTGSRVTYALHMKPEMGDTPARARLFILTENSANTPIVAAIADVFLSTA